MPLFTKPQFNSVWASSGSKLTPDSSKISQGWIVEIPPHEYENWVQGRQDQLLAHLNQMGVPMWDATVEYQAGKSYVQGTTSGVVYRALTTHTNINPEIDISNNWVVAFQASGEALLKSQNLADVPDKAAARTNLGIPDTVFYDGRYLVKTQNLADIPNKATARNNLGLGNSSTRDIGTGSGTVAAGDDTRIVNAVQTSRQVNSGNGLTGGGNLTADRTLSMGTPSTVTATSTNAVVGTTHYHAIDIASIFPTAYIDVTSARSPGIWYTNTTGKIMFVSVTSGGTRDESQVVAYCNGMVVGTSGADHVESGGVSNISWMVPPGATYTATSNVGISRWTECR